MSNSREASKMSLNVIGEFLDCPTKPLNLDNKTVIDRACNDILRTEGGIDILENEIRTSLRNDVPTGSVGDYLFSKLEGEPSFTSSASESREGNEKSRDKTQKSPKTSPVLLPIMSRKSDDQWDKNIPDTISQPVKSWLHESDAPVSVSRSFSVPQVKISSAQSTDTTTEKDSTSEIIESKVQSDTLTSTSPQSKDNKSSTVTSSHDNTSIAPMLFYIHHSGDRDSGSNNESKRERENKSNNESKREHESKNNNESELESKATSGSSYKSDSIASEKSKRHVSKYTRSASDQTVPRRISDDSASSSDAAGYSPDIAKSYSTEPRTKTRRREDRVAENPQPIYDSYNHPVDDDYKPSEACKQSESRPRSEKEYYPISKSKDSCAPRKKQSSIGSIVAIIIFIIFVLIVIGIVAYFVWSRSETPSSTSSIASSVQPRDSKPSPRSCEPVSTQTESCEGNDLWN